MRKAEIMGMAYSFKDDNWDRAFGKNLDNIDPTRSITAIYTYTD